MSKSFRLKGEKHATGYSSGKIEKDYPRKSSDKDSIVLNAKHHIRQGAKSDHVLDLKSKKREIASKFK